MVVDGGALTGQHAADAAYAIGVLGLHLARRVELKEDLRVGLVGIIDEFRSDAVLDAGDPLAVGAVFELNAVRPVVDEDQPVVVIEFIVSGRRGRDPHDPIAPRVVVELFDRVAAVVGDAIETIKLAQRVTEGKAFAAAFPLMLYPGTKLHEMSIADNVPLNQECEFEWHKGIGSIDFGQEIQRRIRALVKLATFFVKYQVEEYWMRALIELPIDDQASKALSESNYLESLIFHQGDSVRERFDEILANTQLSY